MKWVNIEKLKIELNRKVEELSKILENHELKEPEFEIIKHESLQS